MSNVRNSIVIEQTKSGDQLSFFFETDKSLWQGYDEATSGIVPDWSVAANRPTITPKAYSARLGTFVKKAGNGVWTYNGQVVSFNPSTGISACGKFKTDFSTDALTIVQNLASADNKNGDIFTYKANYDNGYAEQAGGQIEVKIDIVGASNYYGYVNLTSSTLKEGEVEASAATAKLILGTVDVSDFELKWYKRGDSTVIGTGKSISVNRSMVNGKEDFYCEFYVGGVKKAVYYFTIYDLSDPVQISFILVSEVSSTSPGKNVVYSAYLQKNGSNERISAISFAADFLNSRKNAVVPSSNPSAATMKTDGAGIKYAEIKVTYEDGEAIASDGIKNGAIEVSVTGNY